MTAFQHVCEDKPEPVFRLLEGLLDSNLKNGCSIDDIFIV